MMNWSGDHHKLRSLSLVVSARDKQCAMEIKVYQENDLQAIQLLEKSRVRYTLLFFCISLNMANLPPWGYVGWWEDIRKSGNAPGNRARSGDGFCPMGASKLCLDQNGKYYDPCISVVRHLYFEKGRDDIGKALLAKTKRHSGGLDQKLTLLGWFWNIASINCNVHLHSLLCTGCALMGQALLNSTLVEMGKRRSRSIEISVLYWRSITQSIAKIFRVRWLTYRTAPSDCVWTWLIVGDGRLFFRGQ